MVIFLLISICILGVVFGLYLILSNKLRRHYLESVKGEKITVYAENWNLKFKIQGSSKSYYVYGIYISPFSFEWSRIVKETVSSQEDLDDFKERLKTVKDVLDYEDTSLKLLEKERQEKTGNFN